VRRWEAFFGARFKQEPGVRHAYVGYDRGANAFLTVTVWDAKPDEAAIAAIAAEFRPQVADLMEDPPVFEEYEVLAEV
jgi:hypothetical protein